MMQIQLVNDISTVVSVATIVSAFVGMAVDSDKIFGGPLVICFVASIVTLMTNP